MKTRMSFGLSILLLFSVLAACGPSDAKIQTDVSKILAESALPVKGVVKKGVVTLSGTVEAASQKNQAESAIKGVAGVKSVTNNVTVTPPPPPVITPDEALTTLVKKSLETAGFSTVNVNIADSVVTLSGDLKRSDIKKVMQIVNDLKPRKVINELKKVQ